MGAIIIKNTDIIDYIVSCMKTIEESRHIQSIQTEHRMKLVNFWDIEKGSRVLEIGCGQGDTTAVLAHFVGETGFVHGIDIAMPTYGEPITLGEAAEHLLESNLGKQIQIDFNVDVMSDKVNFPENYFDYIVFSHCSWYMDSPEKLEAIFKKIRKWGKKLCFAEWDPEIRSIEQYPHLMSILIQSHYECFVEDSQSNIRTIFTTSDIKHMLERTSWDIIKEASIDSPDLQDARWEINITLEDYERKIRTLPNKLKSLIQSEVTLLREAQNNYDIKPLHIYAFVAH